MASTPPLLLKQVWQVLIKNHSDMRRNEIRRFLKAFVLPQHPHAMALDLMTNPFPFLQNQWPVHHGGPCQLLHVHPGRAGIHRPGPNAQAGDAEPKQDDASGWSS